MIVALAGTLAALAFAFSLRTLLQTRAAAGAVLDEDPLEQRLAEKERRLRLGLGRRTVLALGRASLFAGTGLGVWGLTSGSGYYVSAGAAFGLGMVGWAACGEVHRRIGFLADSRSPRRAVRERRQGVDPSERTG